MNKLYAVVADHAEFNETFTNYKDALGWLLLVRGTLGSNAGLYAIEERLDAKHD